MLSPASPAGAFAPAAGDAEVRPMLTLYMSPGSSSMAPHIALHEIGVEFEPRWLSFAAKEQQAPAYLAVNPEGKVPTLLIDGRVLTEVAAVLYYLAKRFPAAGLWPEGGIEAEAQAISWMSFIAATVHPARRIGPERWREVFAVADRRLGHPGWIGARYSIADIHLFRLFWRFAAATNPAPGSHPHLEAHYAKMMTRPAVQRTLAVEREIGYQLPQ
jgi:glutathione S-transferase